MALATLAIDPFSEAFLSDPYAHHAELREAGRVVWLQALDCYAMARFDDVKNALQDHATFCSGRGVGLSDFSKEAPWRPPSLLLEADPPLHARTRSIMTKIVSLQALKAIRPVWTELADALVTELVAKRRFDAVQDLSEVYPMLVFPDTIGIQHEGREMLLDYAAATFNAFGPRNAIFHEGNRKAADAIAWVAQACRRENLTPGGWGMAVFEAADRGECTPEEAERLVRSFLTAGVDTTVNGIGHLLLGFASFPDQWDMMRADPSLAKRAFEESLRWDSTVQTFFRTALEDVDVDGTTIPQGSKVLLFLGAANRDPRKWPDAEDFKIERGAGGHVAFGFGIHQCLGQMVARLESELVLAAMLKKVKSIRLAGKPVRRLNNTLHALASLPVEVEPLD
ncbi:MAG: cytochrome P450 [Sphingobium sp.]